MTRMNRRNYLTLMGGAAGAAAIGAIKANFALAQQPRPADNGAPTTSTVEDRERRMQWWHAARFGMFIHWGLYSTLERHEWVMENDGIPVSEYERLAPRFKPAPNAARRRFVEYIHGQVRELMTNYGKVDILWYDVAWPLDARGWESVEMNTMVRKLQPDIIINNRSKIPEDFDTPEQRIEASVNRPWESCMTLNDSWGYHAADTNWKSPTTVIRNLITCARDGGNYLLNIGPKPDGSIPEESVRILSTVGDWMSKNGATIRESDTCQPRRGHYLSFTRKGNTLYAHVHYWPGETVVVGNLLNKVLSAKMFATGEPVKFQQIGRASCR